MEWKRSWFELELYDPIHDWESWNLLCGYRGPGGEVEIPEVIWGAVEYISDFRGGFRDRTDITGVTIPRFVKGIDGCAFAGCTALTRVTLPERLEYVENDAFAGCISLESVDIPPYADVFPGAFPETCLLRVYKDSVAHRVAQDFGLRHEVRDEPLPPDPRLTEEEREERRRGFFILDPEERPFHGNYGKRRDNMLVGAVDWDDEGVRVLWSYQGPGGEVQIPPVGRISPHAFRDRSDLTAVHLPLETEEIDASAFAGCTGLKTLTLPPYARLTGESNFPEGCLLRVYRDSISHWHVKQRGLRHEVLDEAAPPPPEGLRLAGRQGLCVVVQNDASWPDRFLIRYEGPGGEITVPQNVAVISVGAFKGVSTLTAVTLQNVRDIGDDAFSGCTGLRSVRLSPRLEDIGQGAFEDCVSLKSIELPATLNSIGDRAFIYCSNLEQVTIPEGVEEIGDMAFWGCCSLRSLTLPRSLQRMDDYTFCDGSCLGEECSGLTLRVYEGSYAHRYALDHNIPFELI